MLLNLKLTIKLKITIIAVVVLGGASSYALSHHLSKSTTTSSDASVAESSDTSKGGSDVDDAKDSKPDSSQQKSSPSKKTTGSAPSKKTSPVASPAPVASSTPTGTPLGGGTCQTKPAAANTGSSGALASDSRTVLQAAGEVIQNKSFPNGVTIQADGVQLKNVQVSGGILISEANDVVLDHVTALSIAVSSASNITVQYAHITAFEGDSFHITSDGSSYINNVRIQYSYIDRPGFNPGSQAHWDGVQVRGADNVTIFCNNFDAGVWQETYNVLIYFEPANGGNNHLVVDNNWLSGGNFAIQAGLPNAPISFSITNNKLRSADFHYGYCHLGGFTSGTLAQVVQTGNTLDSSPMSQVCKDSDI